MADEWEDVPDAEAGWEEVPKEALPRAAQAKRDFAAINERARKRTADFVEGTKRFGRELGEKTFQRAPAVATGALTGAAVGAGAGLPGALIGGVLGAAGGSAAYDTGKNISRATGLTEGPQTGTGDIVANMAEEAKWEAMLGPLGPLLGRLKAAVFAKGTGLGGFKQTLSGKGPGVAPDVAERIKEMRELGVQPGVVDVSEGVLPRSAEKVIGKMPFMGTPFRTEYARKVGETNRAASQFVEGVGDAKPLTEVGSDLQAAAGQRYAGVKGRANAAYETARTNAAMEGARIPTDNIRRAAQDFIEEYTAARPRMEYQQADPVEGLPGVFHEPRTVREIIDPAKSHPLLDHARQLAKVEPHLTTEQYEALTRDFDTLLRQAKAEGFQFRNVERVRQAANADFQSMSTPGTALQDFNKARADFTEGQRVFETPAARKFEQVDRNVFRPGFEESGVRNADELMTTAWQSKSPAAMKQLHAIVGPKAFQGALASRLDDAIEQATVRENVSGKTMEVFKPDLFRTALGLEGKSKGQAYQALQTAFNLSGSKATVADLEKLIRVAEGAVGRGAPDAATMVARRLALGGMGAAETALAGGAILHGGPAALIPFLFGRRGSQMLTSPDYLRQITQLLDPTTPEAIKTAILPRMGRGFAAAPLMSDTPREEKRQ